MFSRGHMIWLHIPTPFTSPLISKLDRRHTERLRKEERQLADGRGGGVGVGEEPNHTIGRKPGLLKIIQYSLGFFYS